MKAPRPPEVWRPTYYSQYPKAFHLVVSSGSAVKLSVATHPNFYGLIHYEDAIQPMEETGTLATFSIVISYRTASVTNKPASHQQLVSHAQGIYTHKRRLSDTF